FPGGGGSGLIGSSEIGGNGGGVIRLRGGTTFLFGSLLADGEGLSSNERTMSDAAGAGAGGAILVEASFLTGGGSIRANGGDALGSSDAGGAGGGGRIAIYAGDLSGFTGTIEARGGRSLGSVERSIATGGAGTIFVRTSSDTYGELVIDNGGRTQSFARTRLRPVGQGTIETLAARSMRTSTTLATADTGLADHWLTLAGRTDRAFRIVANTSRTIDTDPASGDLRDVGAIGSNYRGAIVLDRLIVRNAGAFDSAGDLLIVTQSVSVGAGATLIAPEIIEW